MMFSTPWSLGLVLALLVATSAAAAAPELPGSASADVRHAVGHVADTDDAHGKPFAVVDKRDARIHVFDRGARWVASSAVLLGLTPADAAPAGVGGYVPAIGLAPEARVTPSGRFESRPGHNDKGESIVWIDYDASLAIHRLRPGLVQERRAARLASPTPDDNRISLGCVVVPVAFYESVIEPVLGRERAVVYVLPETRPVQSLFDALEFGLQGGDPGHTVAAYR